MSSSCVTIIIVMPSCESSVKSCIISMELFVSRLPVGSSANSTGGFALPEDFLAWHPTCHHNAPNLDELCDRFLNEKSYNPHKVFYLWGHSYEFDADRNWDVIERFAEQMGGHEDIWYATNIEIYEYIEAYEQLRWSADGKIVHNPTATTLYFNYGSTPVVLGAGETKVF